MDLILRRRSFCSDGVFSDLFDDQGNQIGVSLTHAYQMPDGSWAAKVPRGTYCCLRGTHRLKNGIPFKTFEITGVPDFQGKPVSGCLFHKGNYDGDSEGCECLGISTAPSNLDSSQTMVTESEIAFQKFMAIEAGCDQFYLTIS